MSQPITNLLRNMGTLVFYKEEFKIVLENHIDYFRKSSTTISKQVKSEDAFRWQGDFFGLLAFMEIANYMHWFVMRLNGIESSESFNGMINTILLPDPTEIENIRQQFITTHPNL